MNMHLVATRTTLAAVLAMCAAAATSHALTFTQTVNMNGNAITNAAEPTSGSPPSQAATKGYVDSLVRSMGGRTRFVCAGAPAGGDGSLAQPWDSLYALANNASGVLNDTTVIVLPGVYYMDGAIVFDSSYTNLTVTGIDAQNTRVISVNVNQRIFNAITAVGMTFQSLTITCTNFASSVLGGAVLLGNGTLRDCVFIGCYTPNGNGTVFAKGTSLVARCQFQGNRAAQAGALFLSAGSSRAEQCVFLENSSSDYGGAIVTEVGSTVRESRFDNNSCTFSGGAATLSSGSSMQNCVFTGNSAGQYGGAIICDGGGSVQNCVFTANAATIGLGGGGIGCVGGGSVQNCVFTDNTASLGGGVGCFGAGTVINNCAFTGNSASDALLGGGGVYCNGANFVQNSVFTGNSATNNGGAVFCNFGGVIQNCQIFRGDGTTNSLTTIGTSSKWMSVWTNSTDADCFVLFSTALNN